MARPPYGVAILIPFREDGTGRTEQLATLIDALAALENVPKRPALVVVAEQSADGERFNRGALLNIAFILASSASFAPSCATFICHDVDMAPSSSCGAHYGASEGGEVGVVVLAARGSRYAADGCFGGVTVYDRETYERTNGYPNTFWGWGGEDNAQFHRCIAAKVITRRVEDVEFDDLERDADDVAKKLASLDARGARIGAKEKAKLLRDNRRGWASEGLNTVAFEELERATLREDETMTCVKYVVRIDCGKPGHMRCAECARVLPESDFSGKVRKRVKLARKSAFAHDEACRACTDRKPWQIETSERIKSNAADPSRLTCAQCAMTFTSRTKLFRHLETCVVHDGTRGS